MTPPPVDTFRRVATQIGSTAKNWDREELIRCRSTGTDIVTEADLKGQAHPIFANWVETKPELLSELEQPILLASRILEAVGLPWLSDFLVDDVFDECYPGRQQCGRSEPIFAYQGRITPLSIVRHHQSSRATKELQDQWSHHAQGVLRTEFAKLIQWQIDEEMFQQRGWNGYTCRHPRGDLPLSELDRYETIKRFDSVSLHERSRNLTILVMAEYPARLAELRRQGKARGEEYLLTAFMTTVTILHELGHAIYWKDRRSLTRDLREPFYGADLEMELGDSFIAAIFGGWIPVPVREISRLQRDFTFADGIAWRQALSWDHHRMRPKYRAHYSIPVDYVARLFTEASWSTLSHRVTELIRPQLLTGNSNALRSVGLYMTLTRANQHATAAIADFHSEGHGSAWNRRPGAWFRILQFDGWIYPELELPIAGDDAICIPGARGPEEMVTARDPTPPDPSSAATVNPKGQRQVRNSVILMTNEGTETVTQMETRLRGGNASSASLPKARAAVGVKITRPSLRKNECDPRRFALISSATKIPRPVSGGSPVPGCGLGANPRRRITAKLLPLARGSRVDEGQSRGERQIPSLSAPASRGREQRWQQKYLGAVKHADEPQPLRRTRYDDGDLAAKKKDETIPCARLGECNGDGGMGVGSQARSEISVDELKKRLSQLIGVSLTELEKLFDGPQDLQV